MLTKDASTFVGDRARAARRRHVVANVEVRVATGCPAREAVAVHADAVP